MFKTRLLSYSFLTAFGLLVGCSTPPAPERSVEATSNLDSSGDDDDSAANDSSTSDAAAVLDAIQQKNDNCELLTSDDIAKLNTFQGKVDFTFEAYVSFTCSLDADGVVVVGEATAETRAGWSSTDGSFTEQALGGSVGVKLPVEVADVSVGVESEVTVRQAGMTITHDQETDVAVDVSKDLGVVTGTAEVSVDVDGSSATILGSVTTPLVIYSSDCGNGGEATVGLTLSLTADHIDVTDAATAQRAGQLLVQYTNNVALYDTAGDSGNGQKACCINTGSCQTDPSTMPDAPAPADPLFPNP